VPDPERLWSPWRMEYIRRGDGDDTSGCIFCDLPAAGEDQDEANHLLARGEVSFMLLNAFPYNPGHLMAAPYRHVADYEDLTAEELAEMTALAGAAIRAMRRESGPHGFNLGMNLGQVAGAGIVDHLHLHVVPRWGGDTNFMPVVGRTKVLPELLDETYRRLRPWLAQVRGRPSAPPTGPR
jgi:ATP adenylyltransferase